MFKMLLFILLIIPFSSHPQTKVFFEKTNSDTTSYLTYIDSADSISFLYPKDWDTSHDRAIFFASEKLINSQDNYEENIFFGKSMQNDDLHKFLKSLSKAIKNQSRKKIKVLGYEIKTNKNGIEYGVLKNTSIENGFTGMRTHVYFIKGGYNYYLILSNDLAKITSYEDIFNHIIQSISFQN